MDKTDALLHERNTKYGGAWLKTGQVLDFLTSTLHVDITPIVRSGYFLAWFTILCKLIRALASPQTKDHWDDIAGYARLVSGYIESGVDAYTVRADTERATVEAGVTLLEKNNG